MEISSFSLTTNKVCSLVGAFFQLTVVEKGKNGGDTLGLHCLILGEIHVLYTGSLLLRKPLDPIPVFAANRLGDYKGAFVIFDEQYLSLSKE